VARDGALQMFGIFDLATEAQEYEAGAELEDVGPTMVAPFWCDSQGGTVTYGVVESGDDGAAPQLLKATTCVREGFPLTAGDFEADRIFVATWTNVMPAGGGGQVNRLCCIKNAVKHCIIQVSQIFI